MWYWMIFSWRESFAYLVFDHLLLKVNTFVLDAARGGSASPKTPLFSPKMDYEFYAMQIREKLSHLPIKAVNYSILIWWYRILV